MSAFGQLIGHYRYAAIVLVTVLTLVIVGAVVLTTTSAGCGPANALKIQTTHCVEGGKVGAVTSPSPTPGASDGFAHARPTPSTVPPPPNNPGASANPPYNPNASSPYPPYSPTASAGTPYGNPASGSSTDPTAMSCRLPVFAGGPGSGGFIIFPNPTFVADPRSAVTVPSPSAGSASPTPPQQGPGGFSGWYGESYDAAYSRWLAVPWAWVSPDGVHYAYPLGGDIYVQNVANGTQVKLGQGHGYSVLDVENDGVYVTTSGQSGLWFLPLSGAAKQVSATGFWQGVSAGAAYGTVTSSVPQGATNTIVRLDLTSGTITTFYSFAGGQSTVTGFDGEGHPVIEVNVPGGKGLYIVSGPSDATLLTTYEYGGVNGNYPQGAPIADSHGLWFSGGSGIVLWANGRWYPMTNLGGQLAGQCV